MTLAGRGIVVTRPRDLAPAFARLIEARGGRAFVFPTIAIEPLPSPASLARVRDYDWVIFVSPSAVRAARRGAEHWPPRAAAAVGSGTRRELEAAGVAAVVAPASGGDSEALLALPQMQDVAGKHVLIVRGDEGRALLGETLAARGASVQYAACYRRVRPAGDCTALEAAWRAGEVHAITFLSAQALDNFVANAITLSTPLLGFSDQFTQSDGTQLSTNWVNRAGNFADAAVMPVGNLTDQSGW